MVWCRSPFYSGADDRCTSGPVCAPDTVRCTMDSPVPPADHWRGPHVAHGLRGRPLARATRHLWIVWQTVALATVALTGQSGAPPDSPVNYSRTPPIFPGSGLFTGVQPDAPNTVRCTTGQSGVPGRAGLWLHTTSLLQFFLFLFLALRQNMLVLKTMY
jgi:hypothetical protein